MGVEKITSKVSYKEYNHAHRFRRRVMKIADALASAKYVVDSEGNKTEVVIPIETWKLFLDALHELVNLEGQDSLPVLQKWIEAETVNVTQREPLTFQEWESLWDAVVQKVSQSWKGTKSGVEILSEMRR